MLAAATTATTTTAAANIASIAAPTANIRNTNNNNGNNNNMQTKKIVLYNPSVDYSAPLQQQINPDIIGAHPHAQHYQQQCSSSNGSSVPGNTIHNTNQVRQPLQQPQPQQSGQWYYQQQRQKQQMEINNTRENMILDTQEQTPWQMQSGEAVTISTEKGEAAAGHRVTGTHTASILETGQSHDSSAEESQRVVSRKKKTTTTTTTTVTSSRHASEERELREEQQRQAFAGKLTRPTGLALSGANVRLGSSTIGQEKAENPLKSDLSDDSDTEGVAAKHLVIVPTRVEPNQTAGKVSRSRSPSVSASASASVIHTPTTPSTITASSTFGKCLTGHQTLQQQSTQDEYQEFQSTMAAINFARSNSQYDSHIREKRGKHLRKYLYFKYCRTR